MVISVFDDSLTVGKLRLRALKRLKNRRKRTSPSKITDHSWWSKSLSYLGVDRVLIIIILSFIDNNVMVIVYIMSRTNSCAGQKRGHKIVPQELFSTLNDQAGGTKQNIDPRCCFRKIYTPPESGGNMW